MFDSPVIDVVIGLGGLFILMAVAASAIHESAEAALKRRSKFLRAGIAKMLGDDPSAVFRARTKTESLRSTRFDPEKLTNLVYESPLVKALSKYAGSLTPGTKARTGKQGKTRIWTKKTKHKDPSYIPNETFASALIDTAANLERRRHEARGEADEAENLDLVTDARAVLAKLRQLDDPPWLASFVAEASVAGTQAIDALGDTVLTETEKLEKRAMAELAALKAHIAEHFDNAMDRVSGWYKRRTKWWIVLWTAVLVLAFNADAIVVGDKLWNDDAVRASVVAQVQQIEEPTATTCPGLAQEEADQAGTAVDPTAAVDDIAACIGEAVDAVDALDLPLGWPGWPWSGLGDDTPDPRLPSDGMAMLVKLLGLVVTIAAASLGAPFWFGVLNKLANLRASGAPPRETD